MAKENKAQEIARRIDAVGECLCHASIDEARVAGTELTEEEREAIRVGVAAGLAAACGIAEGKLCDGPDDIVVTTLNAAVSAYGKYLGGDDDER